MQFTGNSFPTIKIGIIGAMILTIVAITVPSLLRAGGAQREGDAIRTLKMLNMACAEYSATFTQYPSALSDLQKGQNGNLSSTAADLIRLEFGHRHERRLCLHLRSRRWRQRIHNFRASRKSASNRRALFFHRSIRHNPLCNWTGRRRFRRTRSIEFPGRLVS